MLEIDTLEINVLKTRPQADIVPHRRHAAIDGAGPDGHQNSAVLPEVPQYPDIVLVGAAALDEPDIDRPVEDFLVIEWRAVEINQIRQF